MTHTTRAIVLAVFLAALAGAVGGWAGIQYGLLQNDHAQSLDEALHHELALTVEQLKAISTLETQFAESRSVNSHPTVTPLSRPIMTPSGVHDWAYPRSA